MIELNRNDYPMLSSKSSQAQSTNHLSNAAIVMLVLVFITIIMMLVAGMGELILVDEPSKINFPIPMPNR